MAVYVDPLAPCLTSPQWPWRESCHLFADSLDELHKFALRLGFAPLWFQDHRKLPHYDATRNRRAAAVRLGAVEVTARFMRERMRATRKARK